MIDYMIYLNDDCDKFLTSIENNYNIECSLFIAYLLYKYILDIKFSVITEGSEIAIEKLHKDLNIAKDDSNLGEYVNDMEKLISNNCSLSTH